MLELSILASEAGEPYVELASGFVSVTAWVSIAMLILIGIILWKKVPAKIGESLDKRIAEISSELEEAKLLRTEAEKLRTEYESKMFGAEAEAEDMRHRAEQEAASILDDAKAAAINLVARRKKMAEEKIAAAERTALGEIQAIAARAATSAAATIIAKNHDAIADKALVEGTIASLSGKLN